ncbi:MAG TPA: hypothetical protein VGI39_04875 [Polyangiaceae bacterium]|jgi:hypothetical protein
MAKVKPLTRWIGNRLVGVAWSSDGKWDWTADNGDTHVDYASLSTCARDDLMFLRVTLGPLMLMVSMGEYQAPEA